MCVCVCVCVCVISHLAVLAIYFGGSILANVVPFTHTLIDGTQDKKETFY